MDKILQTLKEKYPNHEIYQNPEYIMVVSHKEGFDVKIFRVDDILFCVNVDRDILPTHDKALYAKYDNLTETDLIKVIKNDCLNEYLFDSKDWGYKV